MRRDHLGLTVRHYAPAFCAALVLHTLVAALATGFFKSSSVHVKSGEKRPPGIVVFSIPPEDPRFPGLNRVDPLEDDWPATPASEGQGDFAFDVGRIAARAQVLFPFATPGLALHHFSFPPRRDSGTSLESPLGQEKAPSQRRLVSRLLEADEAQLQRLIDRAWSRRDRWQTFKPLVKLTETYSGSGGRLPVLLQRYADQNSLQPYADATSKDPRLWVQLGIVAEHVDFIGFVRRYASEHSSTETATALLFLLDNMAQASRDTLAMLLELEPSTELTWTRDANPAAYQIVRRLQQYYRRELSRRGLTSAEAITVHYETARLAVLDEILRITPSGYRAGDALFLKGTIYWRQRRLGDALRSWRAIAFDAGDSHAPTYSQILVVLRKYADEASGQASGGPGLSREINQILRNAHGQWLQKSYDRLHRFGYRVDTF